MPGVTPRTIVANILQCILFKKTYLQALALVSLMEPINRKVYQKKGL
jgi:hypothetical protein